MATSSDKTPPAKKTAPAKKTSPAAKVSQDGSTSPPAPAAPALAPAVLPGSTLGVSTPQRPDALLLPFETASLTLTIDLATLSPEQRLLLENFLDAAQCTVMVTAAAKAPRPKG